MLENTMFTQQQIQDHLVHAIQSAPVNNDPFSHMQLSDCFPAEVYEQMIQSTPDRESYEPIKHRDALQEDGTSTRQRLWLDAHGISKMRSEIQPLWSMVAASLNSDEVQLAFYRALHVDLDERFQTTDVTAMPAHRALGLTSDQSGYKISPHPDAALRVLTVLFYLPKDDSCVELGTSIYRRERIDGKNQFPLVSTAPYLPNSGIAFAVSKKSFHGREAIEMKEGQFRNSMVLQYREEPLETSPPDYPN